MGIKADSQFLNPFIAATKDVLETQASTSCTPQKPIIKKLGDADVQAEIAGVISLNGNAFKGAIALLFDTSTFLKIYQNMVGERHESITEEVQDAAGELLNIIFGQAKTALKERGTFLEKAIPTILVGQKIKVRYKSRMPTILLPFESSAGTFHVEILIDEEKGSEAA